MRVLWLCNIVPDIIADDLNFPNSTAGGWISSLLESLKSNAKCEIIAVFPQSKFDSIKYGSTNNIKYCGFPSLSSKYWKYDKRMETYFREILDKTQPDIVHIWGTEFAHSLAMTKAFNKPESTVCSIQGLCTFIALHFTVALPAKIIYNFSIRDIIKLDNVYLKRKKFAKRGEFERQTLNNVGYVLGRTSWDKTCAMLINPNLKYYVCNESLRSVFYSKKGSWNYNNCIPHSVFTTSGSYPLKGFHILLKALKLIVSRFADTKVFVAGIDPRTLPFYRRSYYHNYLIKLMDSYGLNDNIFYLGALNENEICSRYLQSNVFVSTSFIENSSNSIAEAMMLGVPTVASYVGGNMDFMNTFGGRLYQADAYYMLANHIIEIFKSGVGEDYPLNASEDSYRQHNPNIICEQLEKVYDIVSENKSKAKK